jgi:hypothetical protein
MSLIDAQSLKRFWTDETPSGAIDGSNTVFTLSSTPLEGEAVDVYLDGLKQIPGEDYSISGVTITFVVAPAAGQTLKVDYIKRKGE